MPEQGGRRPGGPKTGPKGGPRGFGIPRTGNGPIKPGAIGRKTRRTAPPDASRKGGSSEGEEKQKG